MRTLASGSTGNGYFLDDEVMVEAGVSYKRALKANEFKRPKHMIITHEHSDHAKYTEQYLNNAVKIYASEGCLTELNIQNPLSEIYISLIKPDKTYRVGAWNVTPFNADHNANEPLAFVFESGSSKILFATDTASIEIVPEGLTEIWIEANFSEELLDQSIESGKIPEDTVDAILGHMSLEHCLEYLKRLDLSKCTQIVLLHLSTRNADGDEFCDSVEELTGIPTYVAGVDR